MWYCTLHCSRRSTDRTQDCGSCNGGSIPPGSTMSHLILTVIFTLFMLPGIAFVLMMLPGIPYLLILSFLYALIDHFTHLTLSNLCILLGITAVSILVDQLAGMLGARWGGARGKTFLFGFIGAVIGTLTMPLFGGLIGLFVGILIGELVRRRTHAEALKAAVSGVIGTATGMAINVCLAISFIGTFLFFALK